MYYFAYGSNLSSKRLNERINAKKIINIKLTKYKLAFHKISKDLSGKCDIEYTGNEKDFVLGVLYKINKSEEYILDRIEGKGFGYDSQEIEVKFNDKTIKAKTYIATNINKSLKPFDWYMNHIIIGAKENNFEQVYIKYLESVPFTIDKNKERKEKELSVY